MSLATIASQQTNAAIAAANAAANPASSTNTLGSTTTGAATAASGASTTNALQSLSSNYSDFLNMLTTQLQNQDPSNPMDSSQFTTELVQFSGVEQQINANNSLTQLIQLTQSGQLLQSANIVGKQVVVQSTQLPLQNSHATVQFTTPGAEPVAIAIYDSAGNNVLDTTLQSTAGSNSWTWNGLNANGTQMPDGAYNIAVEGTNAAGTTAAVPFSVVGTITGLVTQNNTLQLQLGAETVGFGAIQSMVGG